MCPQKQEVISRKMEAAKQAAWGEAGIIIDNLKAALADANQQLCKERAARDQLEEDMKQSFMRSVCAINLEVSCPASCVGITPCMLLLCASNRATDSYPSTLPTCKCIPCCVIIISCLMPGI